MVAKNLKAGLKEIDVDVVTKPSKADFIGCLQNPGQFYDMLPSHTLMGPNLFVLPPEAPHLCKKFRNFVVPSPWVRNKYLSYASLRRKNIQIWPVGIDTEEWRPAAETPDFDCFIYLKDRPYALVEAVVADLRQKNLTFYDVIHYGHYEEEDLKKACAASKFAILLTNTESQGIAYMQILSTDTPCFVLNQATWHYQGMLPGAKNASAAATSVPYFDSRCGKLSLSKGMAGRGLDEPEKFDLFVKNVDKNIYQPRDYILEHHTLAIGAKTYMEHIRKAAGVR